MTAEAAAVAARTMPLALLLVDTEPHTARMLAERIATRGHGASLCGASREQLQAALEASEPDAMVLDFHYERPGELEACRVARELRPDLPVVVLASPGIALQRVEAWGRITGCLDQALRKPLDGEVLFTALQALVQRRRADTRADRFASLVPGDARAFAEGERTRPELAEHAILFTDIRRSTQLVATRPLPEWFEAINRSLSDQGAIVRRAGGSVVKYTGDGLLASFRGRGRAHIALRCAFQLQQLDQSAEYRDQLRIGMGLAEGVVMGGLIGEPGGRQFDVIGATVHLAARLCAIAEAGEIVASPRLVTSAGMTGAMPPERRSVHLRGFPTPVDYIPFPPPRKSRT